MMGRTHAATGAATWMVGCAVAATEGTDIGVHHVLLGAALTAYGAVLPDIDIPKSNVALSLGWPTRKFAELVAGFGAWFHAYTRLPKDRRDLDGHRTVTHTLAFCLLTTIGIGALGRYGGLWVPLLFVLIAVATAVRSLLPPQGRRFTLRAPLLFGARHRFVTWLTLPLGVLFALAGWLMARGQGKRKRRRSSLVVWKSVWLPKAPFVGLAAAGVMWLWPPPSGWWLGLAVGGGCLIHCLGDAMTNSGVPLLFPWEVAGRRWHCVRVREQWRWGTGEENSPEPRIVTWCLVTAALALILVIVLADPVSFDGFSERFTAPVEAVGSKGPVP